MLNNQRRMETALHRATLLRGPRLGYHPRLRAEIGSRNKAWWSQLRMDEKGTGTVAEEEDVVVEDAAADSSAAEISQVGREDASLEDVESASVLEQYRAPIAIGALATLGVVIAAAHPSFDTASLPSFLAKNSPFVTFLMAGTAAMTAEAVTYPFDSIKTRKQLKFEPSTSNEPDTIESRLHNLRSLYFGVRVAVLRHLPYSGTRLMVYEQLRAAATHSSLFGGVDVTPPFLVLAAAATVSGAVGQFVASPADLLKVRMQADGRRVLQGEPRLYKGLGDVISRVINDEGFTTLWTGVYANMARACFMNLGDQAVYDSVKRAVVTSVGSGLEAEIAASMATGVATALLACPSEVVRTRMMNNGPTAPVPIYDNLADCTVKTWQEGGVKAFYQGLLPFYARDGPWYFTFWLTYEFLKKL